jgi:hypothetical protein
MAQPDPPVKAWRVILAWIDAHPRTGWYIVCVVTGNFLLNLADALDLDLVQFFEFLVGLLPL